MTDLRELFDVFAANVTGDDLGVETRPDLSLRAGNVVLVLRGRKASLRALGQALSALVAQWPRQAISDLASGSDVDWLDDGPRERLLKELLGEIATALEDAQPADI